MSRRKEDVSIATDRASSDHVQEASHCVAVFLAWNAALMTALYAWNGASATDNKR